MTTRRPYHSEVRSSRAKNTRLRIRDAARKLFGETGFSATTIPAIAKEAGVSVPTVFSVFGSKAALVASMLEAIEEEISEKDVLQSIAAEPDPHAQLALIVGGIMGMFAGGVDILRAASDAGSGPEVARFRVDGNARRMMGVSSFVDAWSEAGALRPGLDSVAAAHRFWLMTSSELYLLAIDQLSWPHPEYVTWLIDSLGRELFPS